MEDPQTAIILRFVDQATAPMQTALSRIDSHTASLESRIKKVTGAISALWTIIGAYGGYRLAKGFIDTAASLDKTQIMLRNLTGSASAAKDQFDWLADFARSAPFDFDALTWAFVKIKTAGIDPTAGALRALTDALSYYGNTSKEDLRLVGLAIEQMAGKGVLSLEEVRRQLGERIPGAVNVMARELGMSLDTFYKKVSRGEIDAKAGLKALFAGLEKDFGGSTTRMMSSWDGLMTQLGVRWMLFKKQVMDSGVFVSMKAGIQMVIDQLEEWQKKGRIDDWAMNLADIVLKSFGLIGKGAFYVAKAFLGWELIFQGLSVSWDLTKVYILKGIAFLADKIAWLLDQFAKLKEQRNEKSLANQLGGKIAGELGGWAGTGAEWIGENIPTSEYFLGLASPLRAGLDLTHQSLYWAKENILDPAADDVRKTAQEIRAWSAEMSADMSSAEIEILKTSSDQIMDTVNQIENLDTLLDTLAAKYYAAKKKIEQSALAAGKGVVPAPPNIPVLDEKLLAELEKIDAALEIDVQADKQAAAIEKLTQEYDKYYDAIERGFEAGPVVSGKSAEELAAMLDKLDRAYTTQLDLIKGKFKDTVDYMDKIWEDLTKSMYDAFHSYFVDMFMGDLETVEDYIIGFLNAVRQAIANMMAQIMASGITNMIGGWFKFPYSVTPQGTAAPVAPPISPPADIGPITVSRYSQSSGTAMLARPGEETSGPPVKVNIYNNSGQPVSGRAEGPAFNGQEYVVSVWLDAYMRNAYGLRQSLGGI